MINIVSRAVRAQTANSEKVYEFYEI